MFECNHTGNHNYNRANKVSGKSAASGQRSVGVIECHKSTYRFERSVDRSAGEIPEYAAKWIDIAVLEQLQVCLYDHIGAIVDRPAIRGATAKPVMLGVFRYGA